MINKIITIIVVSVWFINGFFCKILNQVPRHQEIVGRILGEHYSREITIVIGILELLMVFWILLGFKSKLNSLLQIVIIITMNIIEFTLAKDLLLFGKLNIIIAFLFVSLIYYQEFILKEKRNV